MRYAIGKDRVGHTRRHFFMVLYKYQYKSTLCIQERCIPFEKIDPLIWNGQTNDVKMSTITLASKRFQLKLAPIDRENLLYDLL